MKMPDMGTNCYIVASCKPWHEQGFMALQSSCAGQWEWVSTPEQLLEATANFAPRYIFFLHWNWLVPSSIWSRFDCVCFHMTDVPFGRGGSPLQNLISAGFSESKLSALRMVAQMDAGPVYAKRHLSLAGRAEDIYLRAGELSFEIIRWMVEVEPDPVPQSGEAVPFKRRTPDQSELPEEAEMSRLYDHIRMLDAPTYPLAFLDHGSFRIEFSHAELLGDEVHAKVIIRNRT